MVAAISIALLIFAIISRSDAVKQALTSDAERVGAQAVAQKNLDLAMLYAVTGVKLQNRLQTRSDLLTVLQDNPDATRLLRPSQNEITALSVDPTGRLLAAGDSAGVVRFEKMSRWRPEGSPVRLPGVVMDRGMAFAPHGGPLGVLTTSEASATPSGPTVSTNASLYMVDVANREVPPPRLPCAEGSRRGRIRVRRWRSRRTAIVSLWRSGPPGLMVRSSRPRSACSTSRAGG